MKLLFKQRFFSWFDSYDIYDESGETRYVVKGQLSWGHRLKIFDSFGQEVGLVQERVLTLLPKFELYVGEQYTIAPSSHVWKGICAAFVIPAKLKQVSGKTTRAGATVPKTMKSVKSMHWKLMAR